MASRTPGFLTRKPSGRQHATSAKLCRPHVCRCGKDVDELGQHGLSYKYSAGRHSRHNAPNESFCRALATAQVSSIVQPPGTFRADKRRPDGMSQVPWKNGKELVWDVTVVDTLAQMNIVDSSRRAGSAAEEAEKRKKAKYVDIGQQFSFCPVGLETFGPWGPSATELFETVVGSVFVAIGTHYKVARTVSRNVATGNQINEAIITSNTWHY
ncbi:hypothetical protein RvY_14809 [Ramazzottius varieornatus]|uniref:Uncharacterized protein n=1 Tax=Ramazzottius varieornatus TaxID=947166 RepID=A0A1D1VU56_RAMVA|nr:hypothetical protein RvY_14809 [Ramazzottius varieornatus]